MIETDKRGRIIGSILLGLFALCLFLPVIKVSFIEYLGGFFAMFAPFARTIVSESFGEYLLKMFVALNPIFLLVLIAWSFRPQLKMIPLSILSTITFITGIFWFFKYKDESVLLYGYWFYMFLIILTIGLNFWKLKTQEKVTKDLELS